MNHYHLPSLSDTVLVAELSESRQLLERLLGTEVNTIAYPFGAHDSRVIEASIQAGYKVLLTGSLNHDVTLNQEKICLPRLCIANTIGAAANKLRISMAFRNISA